jgi:hypothetical protein
MSVRCAAPFSELALLIPDGNDNGSCSFKKNESGTFNILNDLGRASPRRKAIVSIVSAASD